MSRQHSGLSAFQTVIGWFASLCKLLGKLFNWCLVLIALVVLFAFADCASHINKWRSEHEGHHFETLNQLGK